MFAGRGVLELVREATTVVREALSRSQLTRAWELLQERDTEGNVLGALPYTDGAIDEFEAAHQRDQLEVGTLHHLAIAHHARAWDLELTGDARATTEWETALVYWHALSLSPEFWAGLEAKLLTCDPDMDPAVLTDARRNLLENLLEVHVDFVSHHFESNAPNKAVEHAAVIQRAAVPLAVKRRFREKVFQAMTNSVSEAKVNCDYTSAFNNIKRFLTIFPDYLPALRMHAEVVKEHVSTMSYQDDWAEIIRVGKLAEPHARRLAEHGGLATDPLAAAALGGLALEFASRARDRAKGHLPTSESRPFDAAEHSAARVAFEFGIEWGRLARQPGQSATPLQFELAACLNSHALSLRDEALRLWETSNDRKTDLDAAVGFYREAITEMEEALWSVPGNDVFENNLEIIRDEIALTLNSHARALADEGLELVQGVGSGVINYSFVCSLYYSALKEVDEALRWAPDNEVFDTNLKVIRGELEIIEKMMSGTEEQL